MLTLKITTDRDREWLGLNHDVDDVASRDIEKEVVKRAEKWLADRIDASLWFDEKPNHHVTAAVLAEGSQAIAWPDADESSTLDIVAGMIDWDSCEDDDDRESAARDAVQMGVDALRLRGMADDLVCFCRDEAQKEAQKMADAWAKECEAAD